jgi:hypothetical protein
LAWIRKVVPRVHEDDLALGRNNDPFAVTQPMRINRAVWFARIWNTFGPFPPGVHNRRFHYMLFSQALPTPLPERTQKSIATRKAKGTAGNDAHGYQNLLAHWHELCHASRDARYLNLVPLDFDDRRSAPPQIFTFGEAQTRVAILTGGQLFWLAEHQYLSPPGWEIVTADEETDDNNSDQPPKIPQAYHVEIFAEKTTMNDVLVPLCRRLGVNLITGAGHPSTTMADELIKRARASGRPTRVLCITDADKAGNEMSPGFSRKLEFRLTHPDAADLDIQVRRIVLTKEQIDEYDLPPSPFEGGGIELDALEATHPGELERIVEEEVNRYRDPDLDDKVAEAFEAFQVEVDDDNAALVTDEEQQQLDEIDSEQHAATDEYNARLEALNERAKPIFKAIEERMDAQDPPTFIAPEPEPLGPEDDDPLYDSNRDYDEQLERYKREKNGE